MDNSIVYRVLIQRYVLTSKLRSAIRLYLCGNITLGCVISRATTKQYCPELCNFLESTLRLLEILLTGKSNTYTLPKDAHVQR